jgi:hypothetical protein
LKDTSKPFLLMSITTTQPPLNMSNRKETNVALHSVKHCNKVEINMENLLT